MPYFAVLAAGVFAGLWLRSEGDTNGSGLSALMWGAAGAAGAVVVWKLVTRG